MRKSQRTRSRERQRRRLHDVRVEAQRPRSLRFGFDRRRSVAIDACTRRRPCARGRSRCRDRRASAAISSTAAVVRLAVQPRPLDAERFDQMRVDERVLRSDLRRRASGHRLPHTERFEHRHRVAGPRQQIRRRETHDAGTDDGDVGAIRLLVAWVTRRGRRRRPSTIPPFPGVPSNPRSPHVVARSPTGCSISPRCTTHPVLRPPVVDGVDDAIDQRQRQVGARDADDIAPEDRVEKPLDGDKIKSERARVLDGQSLLGERGAKSCGRALDVGKREDPCPAQGSGRGRAGIRARSGRVPVAPTSPRTMRRVLRMIAAVRDALHRSYAAVPVNGGKCAGIAATP